MGLYDLKKTIESVYYTHCIRQGKLPLPDLIYYHWDKKRITSSLNSFVDRGKKDMKENKERSPRKEKKKQKKPKRV